MRLADQTSVVGAISAAMLFFVGCGDAATSASLARALDTFVGHPAGPPGAIAIVRRGEERRVYVAGAGDLSTGAPPRIHDQMRLASVSKAFNGAAALALASRGALSLDDTIGDRLPDLPSAWAAVTLRELLRHQSGIPDYSRAPGFAAAVQTSPTQALPPRALLAFVEEDDLEFTPGSQYRYSNSENVVAGLMVEAATGTSYAQALQDLVYEPLGLGATSLPKGVAVPTPTLFGYESFDGAPLEDVTELLAAGWLWAAGGVLSTPADASRFVRGYVSGQLFDAATHEAQFAFVPGSSQPPGPGENAAGLGVFRYTARCGTMYGHTGNVFGYTQFVAATEDGSRSVTISVNTQFSTAQQPERFADLHEIYELGVCEALK